MKILEEQGRLRLQSACDAIEEPSGGMKKEIQTLIDLFPNYNNNELHRVPWEIRQMFLDALRTAGFSVPSVPSDLPPYSGLRRQSGSEVAQVSESCTRSRC